MYIYIYIERERDQLYNVSNVNVVKYFIKRHFLKSVIFLYFGLFNKLPQTVYTLTKCLKTISKPNQSKTT